MKSNTANNIGLILAILLSTASFALWGVLTGIEVERRTLRSSCHGEINETVLAYPPSLGLGEEYSPTEEGREVRIFGKQVVVTSGGRINSYLVANREKGSFWVSEYDIQAGNCIKRVPFV